MLYFILNCVVFVEKKKGVEKKQAKYVEKKHAKKQKIAADVKQEQNGTVDW